MKSARWLLALIVLIFLTRNLPWHLDDDDQAKQAYTSYEMVQQGNWMLQHTPTGRIATKPPLAGWISAAVYLGTGRTSWDLAWRLPPLACALVMLAMLWRSGRAIGGEMCALLAAAAFGLNLLAPRLATLVRTDMQLAFCIFIAGWLVWEKVRTGEAWTTRERWALFAAVLASMMTKGPIAYVFLLPGLAAHAWLSRRESQPKACWSGAWPWLLPLLFFGAWAGVGLWSDRAFYDQVVVREFLGRFTVGESAVHNNHGPHFYVAQLLHKWMPWSVGLIALCCVRRVRSALRTDPALRWLVCWAVGGLLVMSLVPSKRTDRIFPVIPPLCLLVATMAARAEAEVPRQLQRWAAAALCFAALFGGGYSLLRTFGSFRADQGALVRFGRQAQALAAAAPERLAVVNARDEGMVMYAGALRFSSSEEAIAGWRTGTIDWLLLGEKTRRKLESQLTGTRVVAELPSVRNKAGAYVLLGRPSAN